MASRFSFSCLTRFIISTENSIDSSAGLFSFTKSPPLKVLYHKIQDISMMHRQWRHDAFATQIWCCSLGSQWCDICPKMWRSHTSLGVAVIIGCCPTSFAEGKHHSKRPLLSSRQKRSFCWPARRDSNPRPLESESTAISSFATGGYEH